ncbi:MAG TPA: flavin reductase family protein [Candidatus Limnocylindrales bacterium]|nr:flavin reductase family protein [Candidatus Limnocylindrales bacterium]
MPAPLPNRFRHTLGHFPSGVTIMTTALEGRLHGMTVSAFCSVSLDPALVLVCVEKVTVMHAMVTRSSVFAVNVLGEADEGLARFFADDERLKGPEFVPGTFRLGSTGSPILDRATAVIEARVKAAYDGGDHTILLGDVIDLEVRGGEPPLVFYRGGYAGLRAGG